MNHLKEYISITEKTESLISIFIYNKKNSDVIKFMNDQLEKSKKINNPIKKNKINNRLFNFIKFLNDNFQEDSFINYIFLLHDKIIEYKLNEKEINTALEYNFLNIFIKSDNLFLIEYFIDLFYNFEFIYTIKLNKNDLSIIKINKNKDKTIETSKINNEIKIIESIENIRKINNYKDLIIIYGQSVLLNKLDHLTKNNLYIYKDFLNNSNLYELYENDLMKKNHLLLKEKLDDISNEKTNLDLYVFGKLKFEFKDAIENYLVKELYIEDKKLIKLKTFIHESFFNFKIIVIKSLENGDIAYHFIKDYNGIMAIKYY